MAEYRAIAVSFPGVSAADIDDEDDRLANVLHDAWARERVSLSATVYWLAGGGLAIEPDSEALQRAADLVVAAIKTGAIEADGFHRGEAFPRKVAAGNFRFVARFPPEGDDAMATTDGQPRLFWNSELEPGKYDQFIRFVDGVLIDDVCVDRDAMRRLWPAASSSAEGRRRGRPGDVYARVKVAMIAAAADGYDLAAANEEELRTKFGASRDTCRRVRNDVLGIVEK